MNMCLCGNEITEKDIKDCGYSTFNIGTITCQNCGFELKLKSCDSTEDYFKAWNWKVGIISKTMDLTNNGKMAFLLELMLQVDDFHQFQTQIEQIEEATQELRL